MFDLSNLSKLNLLPFKIYSVFLFLIGLGVGGYYHLQFRKLKKTMIAEKHKKIQQQIVTNEYLNSRLQGILAYRESHDVNELKVAIIEADVLLEEILRLQGFSGDTLSGLLAEASLAAIPGVDRLWRFHRFRNVLVHDSSFTLSVKQGQDILKLLQDAFVMWKLA